MFVNFKIAKVIFLINVLILQSLLSFAGLKVIGKLSFHYNASKGEIYSNVIKIQNTGVNDQEVKIYLRDYIFDYKGLSFYNEPGTNVRTNTSWIKYSPNSLILKGKEIRDIQIEVNVPKGDSLVGTYWSMLMVEGVTPSDPNIKGQMQIHESIRYAIQIVTNIGNSGIGQLEFQQPGVVNERAKKFFDFILLNTGERYISQEVSMELFDAKTGVILKKLKVPKQGMYPTTSTKWRLPLEGVPTGNTYKAVIVADGSGEDVFGLEYTIVL